MTKATTEHKLIPFDAARYPTDDAAAAEYVTAAHETDHTDLLLPALGDVRKTWRT